MARTRGGLTRRSTKPEDTSSAAGRTRLESYTIPATTYKVGDCVLIRPNANGDEHPFLARIEGIDFYSVNNVDVHVRRYYRPDDETFKWAQRFHGKKEVFLSDHWQVVSVRDIEGKCTVHSLNDYMKLGNVGAEDYFCRFEYKHETGAFHPNYVPVYCICEMPRNPDRPMIQCRECRNRYHLECLGMTIEEANGLNYVCSECSSAKECVSASITNS